MLCDKIFRVVFNTPSAIEPEFLSEVLKVSSVRQQIETEATGTSPTMKNISKPALMQLTFPLPDKPRQRELVRDLRLSCEKAAALENEAETIRVAASENVVNAVFS
jgi:type I restriction enzyme, S subunit